MGNIVPTLYDLTSAVPALARRVPVNYIGHRLMFSQAEAELANIDLRRVHLERSVQEVGEAVQPWLARHLRPVARKSGLEGTEIHETGVWLFTTEQLMALVHALRGRDD